jgi:hypothetical protein
MAESSFEIRFECVTGVYGPASSSRDGTAQTVLPPAVLAETGVEVVRW